MSHYLPLFLFLSGLLYAAIQGTGRARGGHIEGVSYLWGRKEREDRERERQEQARLLRFLHPKKGDFKRSYR